MKKFKHTYLNFDEWKLRVLEPLESSFTIKPDYLDDSKCFYTQKQLFYFMNLNYSDKILKFATEELTDNSFQLLLAEHLPTLFLSSISLANDEFIKLKDRNFRGNKSINNTSSSNKTKNKNTVTPTDLTLKDDLSEMWIKDASFVEDSNISETIDETHNHLSELKEIMATKISGLILTWLNNFSRCFSSYIQDEFEGQWNTNLTDELYDLRQVVNSIPNNFEEIKTKLDEILEGNFEGYQKQIDNFKSEIKTSTDTFIAEIEDKLNEQDSKIEEIKKLVDDTGSSTLLAEIKKLQEKDIELTDEIGKNAELVNEVETRLTQEILTNTTNLNNLTETIDKAFSINDSTSFKQTTEIMTSLINSDTSIINWDFLMNKYKQIYAFKNEIRFYSNKNDFLEIEKHLNTYKGGFDEGIDYIILEQNRFIKTGETNTKGGNNYIQESNLPQKRYSFINRQTSTGRQTIWTQENIDTRSISDTGQDNLGVSGNTKTTQQVNFWLNGTGQYTQFEPTYQTVFAVQFLKNVYFISGGNIDE